MWLWGSSLIHFLGRAVCPGGFSLTTLVNTALEGSNQVHFSCWTHCALESPSLPVSLLSIYTAVSIPCHSGEGCSSWRLKLVHCPHEGCIPSKLQSLWACCTWETSTPFISQVRAVLWDSPASHCPSNHSTPSSFILSCGPFEGYVHGRLQPRKIKHAWWAPSCQHNSSKKLQPPLLPWWPKQFWVALAHLIMSITTGCLGVSSPIQFVCYTQKPPNPSITQSGLYA